MEEISTRKESALDNLIPVIRKGQKNRKTTSAIVLENLDSLIPFANHPFTLYEGQRFTDMVESIHANGVLVPIIIRPSSQEKGKYEILSGHNRVAAAKEAKVNAIPAIIKKGLTDEDALLIVTETNLLQRSFADLKHSERAVALSTHYEAIKKKPGYRSDLIDEIEKLSGAPVGHRMKSRDQLGEQYGLGKTTIARYLRINKLIQALKERLDRNEIGMHVAETLSFLKVEEQEIIEELLVNGQKINIKQADELKKKSQNDRLTNACVQEILNSNYVTSKNRPIKLSEQFLSKYFKPEQSTDEIENIISAALDYYLNVKPIII